MKQQTVQINGVDYDAVTGLRIEPKQSIKRNHAPAHAIHSKAQRSKTLNRKHVRHSVTAAAKPAQQPVAPKHVIRKFADIQPAKRPVQHAKAAAAPGVVELKPQAHPVITRAHASHAVKKSQTSAPVKQTAAHLSSKQIKQQVLSDSIKKAPSHHKAHQQKKSRANSSKFGRLASVASASLALLLLAGYFTYLNMPNLSVRVAAAQSGVEASYPAYRPDGYSLNGRIAYDSDSVSMKFASNSSSNNFTLSQSKSDWDSTALKQNYIDQKWGETADATIENGLTIYTHGGEAAWVNGGILYLIEGDAPLSGSQLTRIATSM